MSDKPLVQQALSSELADLVLAITSTQAALAFLRGFWEAMVREWSSIDRLRYVQLVSIETTSPKPYLRVEWTNITC